MGGVVAFDSRNALSFSQGGDNGTATFRPRILLDGDRFRELDMRQSFYDCTQHNSKVFDFDGRPANPRTTQPLIGQEKMSFYVPLKQRRPVAPVRLGKVIVDSFTNLVFGEGRFPEFAVDGDESTDDFVRTISRVGRLPVQMIRARNLGGAMGTVGMSWCLIDGLPRFDVHNAKNLFVHKWADRTKLIPEHVTEVYTYSKPKWDGKQYANVFYWFRRDWTPEADVVFHDIPFEPGKDPHWDPDVENSSFHGDGRCHFEWIQNIPSDSIDGFPDYDGLYDQFDAIDLLNSVVVRGATVNLDPTLLLKVDPDLFGRGNIKKGSDNAISVGEQGDASYLELAGTSITVGIQLIDSIRKSILETAQCVVPDPDKVAGEGTSSVALKMMYAPMLGKGAIHREQYGTAMERMLNGITAVARARTRTTITITDEGTGLEEQAQLVLALPPRVEEVPRVDPFTGQPSVDEMGKPIVDVVHVPRVPGDGGEVNLRWPPFFPPTPADQTAICTNLQVATGGKAFLSAETATDLAAAAFGVDAAEEQKRVAAQGQKDAAAQAAMMMPPAAGGEVGAPNELPPGAEPRQLPAQPFPSPPFQPDEG